MPWEVTIVNYEGQPPASYYASDRPNPKPLGSQQDVITRIKAALPELEWSESGNFPPEILETFSQEIRALMSKPKLKAVFDGDEFSIELYGFDEEPINYLHAEIRGEGNPLHFLSRICLRQRWSVVPNSDGSFVDLSAASTTQWDHFRIWRDRAIASIREAESAD